MATRGNQSETMEAAQQTTMDPAVIASATSVVLSWYYFFAKGDKTRGLFVGLWPPTILAFASYFEQSRMSDALKRATGSKSSVVDSIERVVQGR
jgi:hypothetical protein